MHCPAMFREERLDVLHKLMATHPLATLITAGSNGLMANLIPFTLHVGGEHGQAGGEHVVDPHAEADEADRDERDDDPRVDFFVCWLFVPGGNGRGLRVRA